MSSDPPFVGRSSLLPPAQPISAVELAEVLDLHERWCASGGSDGRCADLFNRALAGIDLSGKTLSRAKLECCDLSRASLAGANLG